MKLRQRLSALIGSLILAGIMGSIIIHATPGLQTVQMPTTKNPAGGELPQREIVVGINSPDSPTISFIDSPSATCSLPAPGTGACYIEWNYLYVTAVSGSYIISMTVTIDNRLRAYHTGFFQSSMYIPGEMTAPGYKVSCGAPGSGSRPDWGKTYSYVLQARETGGVSAANYGSVTCPADVVKIYLPFLQK